MRMAPVNPKSYLWSNIEHLLREDGLSIDKITRALGIGRGTVQRLQAGETSVGLDILTQIADVFGLEVWQLLVPNLDPDALPELLGEPWQWPFSQRLLSVARDAEPDTLWHAENAARAAFRMDPTPRSELLAPDRAR